MKERLKQWIEELEMTKQEKKRILVILIVSVASCFIMLIWDNVQFSGVLQRNTYGGGSRTEELMLSVDGFFDKEIIEVQVEEQKYTKEDIAEIFSRCMVYLDEQILGDNKSLESVSAPLNLITKIPEYPIEIEWEWSPYRALNTEGELQKDEIGANGTLIEIVGILSYGELEETYRREVYLVLPESSAEEEVLAQITKEIDNENQMSASKEYMDLPVMVSGREIKWNRVFSYRGLAILMMGVSGTFLILWKKKQEKEAITLERTEQMLQDYPEIVHLFGLYIGAGLTVKNAWYRIVQSYEERNMERYAYEELKNTAVQMKNGISEMQCYEEFGQRCKIRCYRRFALLLMQNVKKGTKGIGAMLEIEAAEAFQEHKNRTKQMAEKAGTKLLMPMVTMLAVVLTIIVVPAFLSIQL